MRGRQSLGWGLRQGLGAHVCALSSLSFFSERDSSQRLHPQPQYRSERCPLEEAEHRYGERLTPAQAGREPAAPAFVERLSEAIFHQIAGLAATRGVVLERDVPVEVLLADAFDEPAALVTDEEGEP